MEHQEEKQQPFLYRFLVGILIGSGFIVPGVSGGALAAIFGIYERIIGFLANLTKNFKENVLYFIPVGLGALFGIVLFSFGVSYLLANYATIVSWFFVGGILGLHFLGGLDFSKSVAVGLTPFILPGLIKIIAITIISIPIFKNLKIHPYFSEK